MVVWGLGFSVGFCGLRFYVDRVLLTKHSDFQQKSLEYLEDLLSLILSEPSASFLAYYSFYMIYLFCDLTSFNKSQHKNSRRTCHFVLQLFKYLLCLVYTLSDCRCAGNRTSHNPNPTIWNTTTQAESTTSLPVSTLAELMTSAVNVTEIPQTATTTSSKLRPSSASSSTTPALIPTVAETTKLKDNHFTDPIVIEMNLSQVELNTSTTRPALYALPQYEPSPTTQTGRTTSSASAEHNRTSSSGPEPTQAHQAVIKVPSVPLNYATTTSVPLSSPVEQQFSSALREVVENNQTKITTPAPSSTHLTLPPNLPSSTIPEQVETTPSHSTASHKPLTTLKHISCPSDTVYLLDVDSDKAAVSWRSPFYPQSVTSMQLSKGEHTISLSSPHLTCSFIISVRGMLMWLLSPI